MGKVKNMKLRASTLIETIIASVIFLAVFMISLETVSRLTVRNNDNIILVEADYRVKECFREYGDGRHENGQYTCEYDWGGITILIHPYRNYAGLQEITITADIESIAKRLELRHIIEMISNE